MNKTALITGASSGIGYELAKQFARDRTDLVLVARDEPRLQTIALEIETSSGVSVKVIRADLSRATSSEEIHTETARLHIAVDYLINNAGFGLTGAFADTDLQGELDMLQVNIVSLVHLTKLYLRDMRARGTGGILNVASTAAFQPGPFMAVYSASKAFVLSFTEALIEELRGTGLHATALCPGPTTTDFSRRARMENVRLMKSNSIVMMTAAEVAEVGYRALLDGKAVAIPGFLNKVVAQSVRVSPRATVRRIARKLFEPI